MLQVELMRGLSPPDRTAGADHRAGAAEAASFRLAPPPAKAGGGWEGVPTVQADPGAPLPNPPLPSQGREQGSGAVKLFPAAPRRTLRAFDFSFPPAFAGQDARLQAPGFPSLKSHIAASPTLPCLRRGGSKAPAP